MQEQERVIDLSTLLVVLAVFGAYLCTWVLLRILNVLNG